MTFNVLQKLILSIRTARRISISRRVNYFFTKLMTGNKSGALLLTTFVLMPDATNERFTKIRAVSAVQDGNGLPMAHGSTSSLKLSDFVLVS
jgi:hypothetical protein